MNILLPFKAIFEEINEVLNKFIFLLQDRMGDFINYCKSLCRNSKMTKNFHNFHRGYDKGYIIFIADENLFVSQIISIKTYIFSELLKNVSIIK